MKTPERLLLDTGIGVILPKIADYELRRKLLHLTLKHPRSRTGLARLDQLAAVLVYLPVVSAG